MTKNKEDAKAKDEAAAATVVQEATGETLDVTTPAEGAADDAAARDHTQEAKADVVKDLTTTDADKARFNAALDSGTTDGFIAARESAAGGDETAQPPLDVERIKALIEKASQRGGVRMIDLVHQLEREEGLRPVEDPDDETRVDATPVLVEMAGVRAKAVPDIARTLDNWCNAARRALLQVA